MGNGLRLGSIAGIAVHIDWSLLIIFFLISSALALGLFPAWHPDWSPLLAWTTALAAAVLFFVSVLLHELSHALVGRAHGITVRRITLFVFGGMAHMENEPRHWRAEFWMAIVGPITSFVLGVGFLLLAGAVAGPLEIDPENPGEALSALGPLPTLLLWLGPINIILAVFNLVPGFPLDGGRVLRALMWGITGDMRRATRWASRAGQGFAWLLIGTGVAMILGVQVPFFGTGLIGGLWLAFIGWFLNNAAVISYRQLLLRERLEDVPVARVMQTRFETVAPDMTIQALVEEHLLRGDQRAYPVVDGERLLGMICLHDIRRLERSAWPTTTARGLMTPAADLVSVRPTDDALEVMETLARRNVNQLPVLESGRLRGLVRREDILKWMSLYGDRENNRKAA